MFVWVIYSIFIINEIDIVSKQNILYWLNKHNQILPFSLYNVLTLKSQTGYNVLYSFNQQLQNRVKLNSIQMPY